MRDAQRYQVSLEAEAQAGPAREIVERPFRILVVGDLSGSEGGSGAPRVMEVDRDSVDDAMARLRPAVQFRIGADGPKVNIEFRSIDDFHPDSLIQRVPLLAALLETRAQVVSGRPRGTEREPQAPPAPVDSAPGSSPGGGLLDQIVAQAQPAPPVQHEPDPADLRAFIRRAVAPSLIADADPGQAMLVEQVDETIATVVRTILHHPQFQAIEAAWRGLSLLARGLETGPRLKLHILDIGRDALRAELVDAADVRTSSLYRALKAASNEDVHFAVMAGLFDFGDSPDDAALLHVLGAFASAVGARFVAAAAPSLVGLASFEHEPDPTDIRPAQGTGWQELRSSAEARSIILAAPRFLLRGPYDPREEACESMEFMELTEPPVHAQYLWGHPAFAVALVLGDAFDRDGWDMSFTAPGQVSGLPVHYYREAGSTIARPCAETLLSDRAAARLVDAGITPLLAQKNGDTVRVPGVWSVSQAAD